MQSKVVMKSKLASSRPETVPIQTETPGGEFLLLAQAEEVRFVAPRQ
jgi:hypothetical protein